MALQFFLSKTVLEQILITAQKEREFKGLVFSVDHSKNEVFAVKGPLKTPPNESNVPTDVIIGYYDSISDTNEELCPYPPPCTVTEERTLKSIDNNRNGSCYSE